VSNGVSNPFARPKAVPGPPALPEVEDHTGHCARCNRVHEIHFAIQRGAEPKGLETIGNSVWESVYRCVYADGRYDEAARFSRFVALDREAAVRALQWKAFGVAQKVLLYELTQPYARSREKG
jgi:hypothetical protein